MSECIFCKIVEGEIKANKVYEDDYILAFLDANPVTVGHALVITKEHFQNFLYVPKDLLDRAINVAQKIAQAQIAGLGAKGCNILINTNEIAGQSVFHFHIHVIPRYDYNDNLKIDFMPKQIEQLSLPTIANKIKDEL